MDDIVIIRRFLRGFEIIEAQTGKEGIEKIKENGFSCCLLDYRLPDINALELLNKIREISRIPVIILTGMRDERLIAGASKLGVVNFLIKDEIDPEILSSSVKEAILSQKKDEFLGKTEKVYENLVEGMNEGLFCLDIQENIVFTNKKIEKLLGFKDTFLLGKNIFEIMDKENYEIFKKMYSRSLSSSFELSLIRQDGSNIPVSISNTPLFDKNRVFNGCLCVVTDLSRIKEMEKKLVETERLAAASQIAQEAAHDIRNPLSTITAGIYLLKKSIKAEEKQEKIIGQIEDACQRISLYIDDLLNFARPFCVNLRKIEIAPVIMEFLESLSFEQLKGIRIKKELSLKPLNVLGDPTRLKQALFNLVRNASDSMPDGGIITIKTQEKMGNILISISDTGYGIEEENLNKIFSPFFTTKGKGVGLGLSIVKRIIDAHNGKIDVESRKGEGTIFNIVLKGC